MKHYITLFLILIGFTASSQSFYHKRMKKVNNLEMDHCEASKPKVIFAQSLNQKFLYTQKRRRAKR